MEILMSIVKISLIRHAQTDANVSTKNLIGGHNIETRLTSEGEQQAAALGNCFKNKGMVFSAAYCSTAVRTQATAKICFAQMDHQIPVSSTELLLERNPGDWEGQSRAIYKRPDVEAELTANNWTYLPGDVRKGESHEMVANRMKVWIEDKVFTCNSTGEDQHLAVFTHGLSIKFLLAVLPLGIEKATAHRDDCNPIENTSVTELTYCDGEFVPSLTTINNTEHLSSI